MAYRRECMCGRCRSVSSISPYAKRMHIRLDRREPMPTEADYDWPTSAEIRAEEIAKEELFLASTESHE